MAAKRPAFTENFARNLDEIRDFLGAGGDAAFAQLRKRLFSDLVPSLCRFPQAGRSFLLHSVRSRAARTLIRRLRTRLKAGDDLREMILGDYVTLYLVRGGRVVFLSIKHHRQLSFDLRRFWGEP
jgi:plasmid stabilization system protein ParE